MHVNIDCFMCFVSGKQPWTLVFSESPVMGREEQL